MSCTHVDTRIYCFSDTPGSRVLTIPFRAYGMQAPAGFRWDGASSPPWARRLIPKFHRNLKASCRHDWACSQARNAAERKAADQVYREMLVVTEGMSDERAFCGYIGVRIGAFLGYGVRYPHFIKDRILTPLGVMFD